MTDLKQGTIKAIVAMVCITAIEMYALYLKIDGAGLGAIAGILGGLGGYVFGKRSAEKS